LLLDEPFGALDAKVRKELRAWMRRLHDEIHITSVFVTHDQEEAMEVADRVVVMSNGKIEQVGTPEEVYHNPTNSFVYDFLGNYNEFDGWKDVDGNVHLDDGEIKSVAIMPEQGGFFQRHTGIANIVSLFVPGLISDKVVATVVQKKPGSKRPKGARPVKIYARPHEMWVTKETDEHEYINAKVIHLNPAGSLVKLECQRINGTLIAAEIPKSIVDQLKIKKGDNIFLRPKSVKVFE
jgi:sulfate transport system ATP-binding protein